MEVAALCFGPWLAVMVLLVTDVRPTAASASLLVAPDRQQFFLYETVTFSCESELGGGVLHKLGGKLPQCSPSNQSYPNRSTCTIKSVYPTDSGTYVCVFGGRPGSNIININVTEANVILESPALPVMEGQAVSLNCRSKMVTSGYTAHFYKDGSYIGSSMSMSMSIDTVSKSDEGLYRCRIGGVGESAESWLSITDANVILESPALPVMEGQPVSLNCRSKTVTSGSTADFYKDGSHIGSSPAGSMSMSIDTVSKSDEGLYRCSIGGVGESAESWLSITEANVILESPALPVMEGQAVSLSCRSKTVTSGSAAHFYKDGNYIGSSMSMSMSIDTVSKSDEGLYRCRIGGVGESAESWLSITVANVILESPALPVMEGQPVSLNCRSKTVTSGSTADFYKDGSHIGSSPAGSMSMSIDTVSKSDEGLYRCRIGGVGESAESWLSVTGEISSPAPPKAPSCPPCGSTPWLWIVMTLVLALLLVMVGLHRCGKELRRRAPEDAAAYTGTLAQYPVATNRKSDEDRLTPHSFDAPQEPAESEYYSIPDGHEITEECMYSVAEL
ncbi:Fc receptor-like protein 5 isoform 2-T2 [Menidia menidia]